MLTEAGSFVSVCTERFTFGWPHHYSLDTCERCTEQKCSWCVSPEKNFPVYHVATKKKFHFTPVHPKPCLAFTRKVLRSKVQSPQMNNYVPLLGYSGFLFRPRTAGCGGERGGSAGSPAAVVDPKALWVSCWRQGFGSFVPLTS